MAAEDPIALFAALLDRAKLECPDDPTAVVLSTVDADGRPSGRFVLLKAVDDRGLVFYTNLGSRKARDLEARPYAALCGYWPPLDKQIRVEGRVERIADAEADGYFATRPREYQIGAWASRQSETLASREELDARVRGCEERFAGRPVPRPPFWSGYRVVPERIEFWSRLPARLHERLVYERRDGVWTSYLLFP